MKHAYFAIALSSIGVVSSLAPQMKLTRYKHAGSSLLLSNGLILISGGASQAEIYDPRINASPWSLENLDWPATSPPLPS